MDKALVRRSAGRPAGPAQDRSGQIAHAALQLFARRGFNSVSVQEIAKAAGVNAALIYYYFENKQHLFQSALEHVVSVAMDGYEALTATHAEPRQLIEAWLETNRLSSGMISEFIVLAADYRRAGLDIPQVDALIARFYASEVGIIASAIEQGVGGGDFRAVDAEATALWVSTSLDGILVSRFVRPDYDVAVAIEALKSTLFEVLRPRA